MNSGCIVFIACLFFLIGARDGGAAVSHDFAYSGLVEERFERIGSLLGNTWDILGLLRSITIEPVYRTRFLRGVVDEAIIVLDEVAQLSAYCTICNGHCRSFLPSFEDVGDRFAGVKEAFHAVCVPECVEEERVLSKIFGHAIRQFNGCWERALKVGSATESNK